jgi:hypothetical protein
MRKTSNSNQYKKRIVNNIKRRNQQKKQKIQISNKASHLVPLLNQRDGAAEITAGLKTIFEPEEIAIENIFQRTWAFFGNHYRTQGRFNEAIPIYVELYNQMQEAQNKTKIRVHKGMPLCWISDCYRDLGFRLLAKRYMMYTLCEDAITGKGTVSPEKTGSYFRLNWILGLPDNEIKRYADEMWNISNENLHLSRYPEWIMQKIDHKWMVEFPNAQESTIYRANEYYIRTQMEQLGTTSGKSLEYLAAYTLSCIPGFRASVRQQTKSTDYDVVCALEGDYLDFRADLGQYIICECKDWSDKPADVTTITKLDSILDSAKVKCGIVFSQKGLSGKNKTLDADREQLKIFQKSGRVIIVIENQDYDYLANGGNFIALLREKYEKVRLDLSNN